MSFRHGIARNIGAALGLFAMLVVTLLAPVHQAHAAQRDLARASGEILGASVICHDGGLSQADAPADADRQDVVAKCPICSLAKQLGAMPIPALAGVAAIWGLQCAPNVVASAIPTAPRHSTAQPRAPPIPV
jgi:hypothetical protein